MANGSYELVFHGELIEGFDADEVKQRLARLLKLSEERLEQLFSRPMVVLRRGLSQEEAERFRQLFEKAGVRVHARGEAAAAVAGGDDASGSDEAAVPTATGKVRTLPFVFSGSGNEYFKIWIVNIFLSILTLGIYSAWAKVRNKQYFYGNTALDGSSFAYLAKPITILKGRVVALVLFILFSLADAVSPALSALASLLFMIVFPWLVCRALSFNARNSAYRNVRFGFDGRFVQALRAFVLWPLAGVLTLGILLPLAVHRQQCFLIGNHRYGSAGFTFDAPLKDYYRVFIFAAVVFVLAMIVVAALSQFAPGLGVLMLAVYLYLFVYMNVKLTNLRYNNSQLADHGFICRYEMASYARLFLVNTLATVLTLGLFIPWAKVRTARYKAEHIEFTASGDLNGFVAVEEKRVSAIGQEVGDIFDMDIGL